MKIPASLKLMGQTIDVVFDDSIYRNQDYEGYASYRSNKIVLQTDGKQVALKPSQIEQTFLHELVHHISYHAGAAVNHELKKSLHQNEEFVDLFSHLLHQALTSMEYANGE